MVTYVMNVSRAAQADWDAIEFADGSTLNIEVQRSAEVVGALVIVFAPEPSGTGQVPDYSLQKAFTGDTVALRKEDMAALAEGGSWFADIVEVDGADQYRVRKGRATKLPSISIDFSPTATAPAQFGAGDWSLADSPSAGGDTLTLTIITLPANGGSAITALQYSVGGGAAQTLTGTGTGARAITVPASTLASITVWAVNSVGAGTASAAKTATPTSTLTAPVFTTQPTITPASGPIGTVFTVNEGVASGNPSPTLAVTTFTQAGVDVSGDLVGDEFTSTADGALALVVTATNSEGSAVSSTATATVTEAFTTLAYPTGTTFPVTLQRSATEYRVLETAADFDNYAGSTIHIATSGNDTTGDGSSGSPYATLDKAILEATSGDIISMAAGIYATPSSAIAKDLKMIAPSGRVLIGALETIDSADISKSPSSERWLYTAASTTTQVVGFVRLDNPATDEERGFMFADIGTEATDRAALGYPTIQRSASTGNTAFSIGGLDGGSAVDPRPINDAGNLFFWRETATDSFDISGDVWIGEGISICNFGNPAVDILTGGRFVRAGANVYGGNGVGVSLNSNGEYIAFGGIVSGAVEDVMDGRATGTVVQVGVRNLWPGNGSTDNATTQHGDAVSLNVDCIFKGGNRVAHDIENTVNLYFGCTIGDCYDLGDGANLRVGGTGVNDVTKTTIGEMTFVDPQSTGIPNTNVQGTNATLTTVNIGDAWPYPQTLMPTPTATANGSDITIAWE